MVTRFIRGWGSSPKSTRRVLHWVLCVALVTAGVATAPQVASAAPTGCTITSKAVIVLGTKGDDVICLTGRGQTVVAASGNDEVRGTSGIDIILGGDGNDRIFGGGGHDFIDGGAGSDSLLGEAGNDLVIGGRGDDVLDGGEGSNFGNGGDGYDRCGRFNRTIACESLTVDPLIVSVTAGACQPSLVLDAYSTEPSAELGSMLSYGTSVRNEPIGACVGITDVGAVVAGTVKLTSLPNKAVNVSDFAMWLEKPNGAGHADVLPTGSQLATDGGSAPGGCPGGSSSGCAATIGDTVGNVSYPDGVGIGVAAGESALVPFRFFPKLMADDVAAALAGKATLAFAATLADGTTVIGRTPTTFANAQGTQPVTVTAVVSQGTQTRDLPAIAAGEQVDIADPFTHDVVSADSSAVVASFQATAGTLTSNRVDLSTPVVANESLRPTLQPAVWPLAATVGSATLFTASVQIAGDVVGPVTFSWPDGSTSAADDGNAPDLAADDHVFTASFSYAPDVVGPFAIGADATVDGQSQAGTATVQALGADIPTSTAGLGATPNTVATGAGPVLADRFVLVAPEDTGPDAVSEAASTVGGTIAGFAGPGTWQISIPAVTNSTALDEVLKVVSEHPAVIGAQPEALVDLSAVTPNDPQFAQQTNLKPFNVDDAWMLQRGDAAAVIAVIDAGINLSHPDLAGKVLAGTDIAGHDSNPNDEICGHGTHVAGIAAAKTNNGVGVAGVSWGARILPVKVFPDGNQTRPCPSASDADIAAGIDWAVAHGAAVINMSIGGPSRHEDVVKALQRAWQANRVVVAAAGNTGNSVRQYPGAYEAAETFTSWFGLNSRTYTTDVIAVGNLTDAGSRSSSSTYGPWVDVGAPGTNVLSTYTDSTPYARLTGTSMASPFVAGVAALLRSETPAMSTGGVRTRIVGSGVPDSQQVGPRIDVYEAVVNGSFEAGFTPWRATGTVTTPTRLGPITPRSGQRMLSLSTGPDSAQTVATLRRRFTVPTAQLASGQMRVRLRYNYVSEEYPEFVGSAFNDRFTIDLVLPDGTRRNLVTESVNTTAWTPVSGINFPGGDSTVGQSGWRTAEITVPAAALAGQASFELEVRDVGDAIYDSVGLVDSITIQ